MEALPSKSPFPELECLLEGVSLRITTAVHETVASVHDLGEAMLASQARLLRPGLLLAVSGCSGRPPAPRALGLAEMLELIHYASLLHERGAALPDLGEGEVWNQKKAILLGDLLLARAMTLLGEHGDHHTVARVARITSSLAEGQMLEISLREEWDSSQDLDTWMETLVRCKQLRVGTFLGQAALLGGDCWEISPTAPDHLEGLGSASGVADALCKELEQPGADWPDSPERIRPLLEAHLGSLVETSRNHLGSLEESLGRGELQLLPGWINLLQKRLDRIRRPT